MFDIHQAVYDEYGEEEGRVGAYIDGLIADFAESPEGRAVLEANGEIAWAGMMMEYAFSYIGCTPPEMTLPNFNEVVYELFPRKVSTEPDQAGAIITELRAFWNFLSRQYQLGNAATILATLDDRATGRLKAELADPANYGMAKSFFMMGSEAGFDMTTPEGLAAFQLLYNANLQARLPGPHPALRDTFPAPPILLPPEKRTGDAIKQKRKEKKRERDAKKRNRR